jgi:putative ABC transport system substrate-binding protein
MQPVPPHWILTRRLVQALVVHSDSLSVSNRTRIMTLPQQHGLPSMAEGRAFVEAGALISYAPSSAAMMRNAGVFVDRIFKGARPADLPVQRPTRIELVINLKTASLWASRSRWRCGCAPTR